MAATPQWEVTYLLPTDTLLYTMVVNAPTNGSAYQVVESMIPGARCTGYRPLHIPFNN